MNVIIEPFTHAFMQQALLAGSLVAICCSVLGVFLVLRRYSMIGDGLSHVAIGTIGFALFMGWSPLYFSIPAVTLASLAIPWLADRAKVYGDAAIAMLSGVGMALGILFVSIGRGPSVELKTYLFGSILAITKSELIISSVLAVVVIATVCLLFHDLFACTFEPEHARVLGIRTEWIDRALLLTSGLTVILAVKFVGAVLVTSLIAFPAVIALQLMRGFRNVILFAAVVGVLSVVVGIWLSWFVNCPSGSVIVLTNLAFFIVSYLISRLRS